MDSRVRCTGKPVGGFLVVTVTFAIVAFALILLGVVLILLKHDSGAFTAGLGVLALTGTIFLAPGLDQQIQQDRAEREAALKPSILEPIPGVKILKFRDEGQWHYVEHSGE